MIRCVIFGGTTEGRVLCETCSQNAVPVLYCAATEAGGGQVADLPHVRVLSHRMDSDEMAALLAQCKPSLVLDATHPYAEEVSRNIAAACLQTGSELVRVVRDCEAAQEGDFFSDMDGIVQWLARTEGIVFAATGASGAKWLSQLQDYRERVWIRILPHVESIQTCLDLGYRPDRLICMQGPFSEELNYALFLETKSRILITKNSGAAGGFGEKIRAAGRLGMKIAVLHKPGEAVGITLERAAERIQKL